MPSFGERIKRTWNAFIGRDPTYNSRYIYGPSFSTKPDRVRLSTNNARSIVNSIYNRIAVDCSQIEIKHVRLDDKNENYKETIKSSLNNCLTLNANIDQTGRALIQDAIMSMFDEGCVAIIPVDTDEDPETTESYKIGSLRVGKITEWHPYAVTVLAYDERTGRKKEVTLQKRNVAIIENPFYTIMNEPNSILQRAIRILNQLDRMNEKISSNKLDLIITLPYQTKTPAKQEMAEARRKNLEAQLEDSKLGVGYIDVTEKLTQLNRPIENNLWAQAKDLTSQLFNQLGLTEAIFNGTADDKAMLNYYNRTIEPIMSAITIEMTRKWLSPTARAQYQSIWFIRDPFKLVPVGELAEIVDKFTRNEVMSSNEFRAVIGRKPSKDPKADQLTNSNLYQTKEPQVTETDNKIEQGKTLVENAISKFQNE